MLILKRHVDETIEIRVGETVIRIMVTEIDTERKAAKLGFDAPPEVSIHRTEVQQRIDAGVPRTKPVPVRPWKQS